ncbi:hypothetical protein LC609_19075 [Nostoc sp. XA013]|nr:hypothetical protein [Nostoc sp. XA013]
MLITTKTPLISYEAMQKSARIIKYVYQFYFPIHCLSPNDICTFSPVLTCVEATIYQADLIMEEGQTSKIIHSPNDDGSNLKVLKYSLINLLKELNYYDSVIEQELAKGEEFIQLENKIMVEGLIKYSDVMRIAELRSSDIRLLHLILFQMLGKPYDENLLSLVWLVEVIADIEDDFNNYAADVAQNSYNTYRMFVALYKEKAPQYIKAELEHYENLFEEKVAFFGDDEKQRLMAIYSQFRKYHFSAIPEPIIE